jgi:molybdopterin synthase catalytic subunit
MIEVRIRFFARHRDIVGTAEAIRTVDTGCTVGQLWERLVEEHPRLHGYTGRLLYAVNQQFAEPETVLSDGDEVAYIPPVSGGAALPPGVEVPQSALPPLFAITEQPLDPAPLVRAVQTPADGAVVTFAGVVRNQFGGRATACLSYEAYAEMALPVLQQIAEEARVRWSVGHIAVHHRVGKLEIGETAVLVVVAAPHRQPALDAAGYVMDRIKQIAPIWKREHWADGGSDWQE